MALVVSRVAFPSVPRRVVPYDPHVAPVGEGTPPGPRAEVAIASVGEAPRRLVGRRSPSRAVPEGPGLPVRAPMAPARVAAPTTAVDVAPTVPVGPTKVPAIEGPAAPASLVRQDAVALKAVIGLLPAAVARLPPAQGPAREAIAPVRLACHLETLADSRFLGFRYRLVRVLDARSRRRPAGKPQ